MYYFVHTASMLSTLVKSLSLIILVLDGGLCQEEWKRQLIGSGTEPTSEYTQTACSCDAVGPSCWMLLERIVATSN